MSATISVVKAKGGGTACFIHKWGSLERLKVPSGTRATGGCWRIRTTGHVTRRAGIFRLQKRGHAGRWAKQLRLCFNRPLTDRCLCRRLLTLMVLLHRTLMRSCASRRGRLHDTFTIWPVSSSGCRRHGRRRCRAAIRIKRAVRPIGGHFTALRPRHLPALFGHAIGEQGHQLGIALFRG